MEPFYGGSHRDFARGWVAHSRHDIQLVTLPDRFWKWRMRGAALHFFETIANVSGFDGIITTGLMSLSDFTALCRGKCPPTLVYMHENQLTYPLAPGERMDMQFGFTDITTGLCADRILFNSQFHFDQFFATLPAFIGRMPEFKPWWAMASIREKAGVLYPGCHFDSDPLIPAPHPPDPPLVIWNHRWEFDKNPDAFFGALDRVAKMGVDFRLAILGENSQVKPRAFLDARSRFRDRIVHYGYVESKREYMDWLKQGVVTVSTAIQENFGIAVVEAMRQGCLPLLPKRLSYPEILPAAFHDDHLYDDDDDLAEKLASMLAAPHRFLRRREALTDAMACHAWPVVINRYDQELALLARVRSGMRDAGSR